MSSRGRSSRYSRSRSRSPRYSSRRCSRSRSLSPRGRYGSSGTCSQRRHSHSRSPMSNRRRHVGSRDAPEVTNCLGIFGLSLYTTERELEKEFSKFGPIEKVTVVLDGKTGRSRGFAFVYFESLEDSKAAKEAMCDQEIDGRRIRVDYSITKRPHTPTPGVYMGRPTFYSRGERGYRGGGYRRSPSPYYRRENRRRDYRSRSRSYSPRRY
ncbi:transformer-2 protein homolog beta [Lepeophtheirus salmonis]|uniref:transformer-2 protein homolog beta n=1 Tax=Lepeophtheirus salmonis TaxID=72036 RepID=UPI001AE1361A|nr:transformer-2 protein homolog beta-like [Lepeophtheirus salmonis]